MSYEKRIFGALFYLYGANACVRCNLKLKGPQP
jgi:hypothetical protein